MTQPSPGLPKAVRFGLFEVDFSQSELRKRGRKILLQDQPFKLLALLLQRPGEIVAREELQQSLWPADTFVDFDESLNKAIQKIRQALGDSSDNPHLIETIPRRGYRFIAPVELLDQDGQDGQRVEPRPTEPAEGVAPPETARRSRRETMLIIALAAAIGIAIAFWARSPGQSPTRLRKFVLAQPGGGDDPMISPDGRHIAYIVVDPKDQTHTGGAGPVGHLWIQDLDRDAPREIEGAEGAYLPFWSPDSEFVGFAARKHLWKAPVQRGGPVPLCELPDVFLGGTWSLDGHSIVFSIDRQGIYEVPAGGGAPKVIVPADRFAPGNHCDAPYLLPAGPGRNLLCAAQAKRNGAIHDLVLHSLDSGKRSALVPNVEAAHVVYSPTGHLLYEYPSGAVQVIMALPFSLATMKAIGDAFPIARIGYWPSVSQDGTLVYQTGAGLPELQLTWHDRSGNRGDKVATVGPVEGLGINALSPDGHSVSLTANVNSKVEIWIFDVTRGTKTRLSSSQWDAGPIWSRSGKEITFDSNRQGHFDIYTTPADGSGEAKALVVGPVNKFQNDWSPDGRFLVYQTFGEKTQSDIWYRKPTQNGSGYESEPFLRTAAGEWGAKFSPDGHFLAYVSDESGRTEIYVRRFPDGSGKQQVSVNGGGSPHWRRDGKELFYLENDTLVAVSVATNPGFAIGATRRLFKNSDLNNGFAVSADGQRFLLVEPTEPVPQPVFRVVENWFAEFGDRASRDR